MATSGMAPSTKEHDDGWDLERAREKARIARKAADDAEDEARELEDRLDQAERDKARKGWDEDEDKQRDDDEDDEDDDDEDEKRAKTKTMSGLSAFGAMPVAEQKTYSAELGAALSQHARDL